MIAYKCRRIVCANQSNVPLARLVVYLPFSCLHPTPLGCTQQLSNQIRPKLITETIALAWKWSTRYVFVGRLLRHSILEILKNNEKLQRFLFRFILFVLVFLGTNMAVVRLFRTCRRPLFCKCETKQIFPSTLRTPERAYRLAWTAVRQ